MTHCPDRSLSVTSGGAAIVLRVVSCLDSLRSGEQALFVAVNRVTFCWADVVVWGWWGLLIDKACCSLSRRSELKVCPRASTIFA